ncbi:MAG: hypothetical protein ACREH4_02455 [Vitreimonas sp.]
MLIPYHRFVLRSRLSPQRAFGAMVAQTSLSDARWFQGEVDADGFKVQPAPPNGSIFGMVASGSIQPDPQGSHIVVSVRWPIASLLFVTICLAIPGSAALAEAPRLSAAAGVTALFYGLLMLTTFWPQAIKQERMLRQILGDRHAVKAS